MKISVIMPVYNAAETLSGTLDSFVCGKADEIEIVVIDDGSTDSTKEIIENHRVYCSYSCRIVSQENQGVAAARNRGLECALGDYLMFLDADDHFEDGALDRILDLTATGEDIIGWDLISESKGLRRYIRQGVFSTPQEALKNLMGGTMKWNLWLFAIRRDLVEKNGLRFSTHLDIGEDMAFMLKAFACAKTVRQVKEPLYRYNASNPSSISAKVTEDKRIQVSRNLASVEEFFLNSSYADFFKINLPFLKLYIKRPLLVSTSFRNYRLWLEWLPESTPFAMSNQAEPFRIRLLQGLAARKMWVCVWIYNILVYKVLMRIMR